MASDNILFNIIGALFNDRAYIWSLPAQAVKSNWFMINRRVAARYPLQAQVLNNSKINPVDGVRFWSDYLSASAGGRTPNWVYLKGVKKSQVKSDAKRKVTAAQIRQFAAGRNISVKDVEQSLRFFPDDAAAEIIEYDKMMSALQS